jgi:hypothetical protein
MAAILKKIPAEHDLQIFLDTRIWRNILIIEKSLGLWILSMRLSLATTLICILSMFHNYSYAQWTEPIRITEGLGLSTPRAVAVGDTLHVVASRITDFYYLRSTNSGESWTDPVAIADTFDGSGYAEITRSRDEIHLAWVGRVEHVPRQQIFYTSSSNGGRDWNTPVRVFSNSSAFLKYPRLAVNGDTLFLTCAISQNILLFRSLDGGATWPDSIILENGPIVINDWPVILYSEGRLHLVYQLNIVGDSLGYEIYYRNSDDYGLSWSDRSVLSTPEQLPDYRDSLGPSAFADANSNIVIVWYDYKYGSECGFSGDIVGRISLDNGDTWQPESRITFTQTGSSPSCIILYDELHVVWGDELPVGCFNPKIMYSRSADWGLNWTEPEIISGYIEQNELSAFLFHSSSPYSDVLHCVMSRDEPDGGRDLYYFQRGEINSVEDEINPSIYDGISLTAYPNPFNSSIAISFINREVCNLNIEIFNIRGQRINTFDLKAQKNGTIIWRAIDDRGNRLSTGIYFVKAENSRSHKVIKLIYLK